jgi:hypothetical protein
MSEDFKLGLGLWVCMSIIFICGLLTGMAIG